MLFRWKGSIYKLVLADLFLYGLLYYGINCMYRFWLLELDADDEYRRGFHQLVAYCSKATKEFPLQFVLGFYVSQIVTRWWSQYMAIPWPDSIAILTATCVQGHDERGRMMRRTILRYVNMCMLFVFSMVSTQARKRFPDMQHMVDAGFMLPHEKAIIEHLNEKLEGPKYFVPLVWATSICSKARKEGRIRDDVALYHLMKELCKFRLGAGDLVSYDWICIPLVYTQVVTLAMYIYFLACLIGKQLIKQEDKIDMYVALFQFLEFFFMMGWLKVAETLINPFGEDDDDFEVNWLIDRNIMVSYMIVDEMNTEFPEMVKDHYWDSVVPEELYYNDNAKKYKTEGYMGSAAAAMSSEKDNESRKGEGSILHPGHAGHAGHPHPGHHARNTLVKEITSSKEIQLPLPQNKDTPPMITKAAADSADTFIRVREAGRSPLSQIGAIVAGSSKPKNK